MQEYLCYTNRGKWKFYAGDDIDAIRLALFYCWIDGDDFIKIESGLFSKRKTLCIYLIDDRNTVHTLK